MNKQTQWRTTSSLLAASAALGWLAAPAHAQDTTTQNTTTQNTATQNTATQTTTTHTTAEQPSPTEIVVTAQFREQRLQDTPLAITAVNAAMMEARSQTSVQDIANQAPSVTLKPQGAAFGPSLGASIRGVGQYDFNPALEPGVGMYVDDVYYATLTGAIFDLLDLDRVEVLRGPQGTLAGKNSIGGAVKLYSRRPTGSNTGSISGTYGSRNRLDLRASGDFKLADDLYVRLAGVARRQEGYVDRVDFGCAHPQGSAENPTVGGIAPGLAANNCVVGHDGEVNYQASRVQLRYAPGDVVEINLIADYSHDDRNNAAGVLTYANNTSPTVRGTATNVPYDSRFICGKFCNYASYFSPAGTWEGPLDTGTSVYQTSGNGRTKLNNWGVSGQVDLNLTHEIQLQSITSYRDYTLKFNNDDDFSPLAVSNGFGDLTYWGFTQELRLNGSMLDNTLNWTVGGFYLNQKSVYATVQDLRYTPFPLQFAGNDPVKAGTKAVFANASWEFIPDLTANVGIRYSDEHKSYTFSRRNLDGTLNARLGALDGVTGKYKGDHVDYRANLQYRWAPELMTYAQVSTGFKGGGINPRPFTPAQVQSFGPEKLTAYEVGFKSDLLDHSLRINGAAFYSDYKGVQLSLLSCPQFGGPGPCALPQNAGDAHIKGLELEASYNAGGLTFDASGSYVDFKYTSINPQAGGPTAPTGVQKGMVPPYSPKWKWAAGLQYEFDLGDSYGSLTPRFDASYQSKTWSNAVNGVNNEIPGYTLTNARLTWRNTDKDLDIALEVTNLFDKYYYLTSFDLTGAGAGVASAQPGRPREWAVTVRKKF